MVFINKRNNFCKQCQKRNCAKRCNKDGFHKNFWQVIHRCQLQQQWPTKMFHINKNKYSSTFETSDWTKVSPYRLTYQKLISIWSQFGKVSAIWPVRFFETSFWFMWNSNCSDKIFVRTKFNVVKSNFKCLFFHLSKNSFPPDASRHMSHHRVQNWLHFCCILKCIYSKRKFRISIDKLRVLPLSIPSISSSIRLHPCQRSFDHIYFALGNRNFPIERWLLQQPWSMK